MKIALFTDTFYPQVNGVANTVYRYANALAKQGHDVRVYTVSLHPEHVLQEMIGDLFTVRTVQSIPLFVYPGERIGLPFVRVDDDLRTFNPDIIHTHTPFSMGAKAAKAAKKLRAPLIGTHHTFLDHYLKHIFIDFEWSRQVSWDLTIRYYNRCRIVISPSHSLANYFHTYRLRRPLTVLPNILDTEFFSPAKSEQHPFGSKTLIYMGRLSYEKNVKGVVDAAAIVIGQMPETKLLIVGDGNERGVLESYIRQKGIEKNTTITGFIHGDALVDALRSGDVFLTASKSENMPLALMEAMAVGLPIVATRSLGLAEMLEDGGNAYLTNPDSPQEMASKTLALLGDDTLRARFAARSRERSMRYSEAEVILEIVRLYEKAIAG